MSWRVVVITKRCKLEYKLGYLVCRGEELKKVYLAEIDTLLVESTGVSLTAALLCELIRQKVNVIFCNEKHNPFSQLLSLNGRHNASGCLRRQLEYLQLTCCDLQGKFVILRRGFPHGQGWCPQKNCLI